MRKFSLLILAIMLAIVPLAQAEFNADGYPIVEEVVTLKVVTAENSNFNTRTDMWALKRLEQETGVRLEIERIDETVWSERKALMFSSNELPDIILGALSTDEQTQYYTAGQLTNLDDMIEYMPDYMAWLSQFDAIERAKLYNSEGSMIGFVGQASEGKKALPGARAIINQQWLDAVDLPMPTNWDELVTVLMAFRDQDPNGNGIQDEIPLSGASAKAPQFVVTESLGISNNADGSGSKWYEGENGELEYLVTSDLYKTFLERMHFLYAEGLLDSEIYTQTNTQFLAKGANMQVGMCVAPAPFVLAGTDPEKYEQYVAFGPIYPEGGAPKQYFNEMYGANLFITSANAQRQVTARLLNYLYTEDWAKIIRGPQLGEAPVGDWNGEGGWYYIDDTQTKYSFEVPEGYSGVYYWRIADVSPLNLRGGMGYTETFMNEVMSATDTHLRAIYTDTWQYTVPCFPQVYSLSGEEMDEISLISSELSTYVDQMETKFIIGEVSIEDGWDDFQAHLESIGVETYVSVHQAAYERYLEIARKIS